MGYIDYPIDINTNEKRYAYCYRLQELLRIEHNNKQQDFKDGIINKNDLDNYLKDIYKKKDETIIAELLIYRDNIKKDVTSIAKLTDVII